MPSPKYSQEVRDNIIEQFKNANGNITVAELAKQIGVSTATITTTLTNYFNERSINKRRNYL